MRKVILFVLSAVVVFGAWAVWSQAAGGQVATSSPSDPWLDPTYRAKVVAEYKGAKADQHKADYWSHKYRGHYHRGHVTWTMTHSWKLEHAKHLYWRSQAVASWKGYKAFVQERLNKCSRAGFPNWYCPILIQAANDFGKPDWAYSSDLAWIISKESGFNPCIRNGGVVDCNYRGDLAFGLFQFLGSTWSGVNCSITSQPYRQTICGFRYISGRYGTPAAAANYWRSHGSY